MDVAQAEQVQRKVNRWMQLLGPEDEKAANLVGQLATRAAVAELHSGSTSWKHRSVEDLVLSEGRAMTAVALPEDIDRGEIQQCYTNSFALVAKLLGQGRDVSYCEGFATSPLGMAVMHAWVLDNETGTVLDPTWEDPVGSTYFGIAFSAGFVMQVLVERDELPILDDWRRDFRILREGLQIQPLTTTERHNSK